jgi:diphthine-ammonia ligase
MKLHNYPEKRASILWTGGKDCALAFYEAEKTGYKIINMVTLAPPEPDFKAHPVEFMKTQAKALGLPHHIAPVHGNLREGYIRILNRMITEQGIDAVVTGDVAEVEGYPNWIKECCRGLEIETVMPLWGLNREEILNKLVSSNFKAIISCVRNHELPDNWVGREINAQSIEELKKISMMTGMDICGEQGEFHTLTLNGPIFKNQINIKKFSHGKDDFFTYLIIKELEMIHK